MPLHEVKQREAIVGKKLKYRGMLREGRVILTRFRTPWCQPPIDGRKVTSFLAQGGIFSVGIASPAFKEEKGGQSVFLEPAVFQVPLTGNSQNAGWHLVGWCVPVPSRRRWRWAGFCQRWQPWARLVLPHTVPRHGVGLPRPGHRSRRGLGEAVRFPPRLPPRGRPGLCPGRSLCVHGP